MSDFYEDMGCDDINEFLTLYDDDYGEENSEDGILMTDDELIEVTYQKDAGSYEWKIYQGTGYPIIKKEGDILTVKDVYTDTYFKAKVSRDKKWKATSEGTPVKINVIEKDIKKV